MTGWGQDGPLAHDVGHDINYIALAGVLAHIGTGRRPAGPADQPRRRLRRRRAAARVRHPRRARRARRSAARARWSTRRWSTARAMQMSVFVGLERDGLLVRRPRHQPARRRRALLRRVRDDATASTSRSRATSRSSTPSCVAPARPARHRARPGDPDGPVAVAGAQGADGRRCSAPAPAPSGSSSSPATTCASRRSSR